MSDKLKECCMFWLFQNSNLELCSGFPFFKAWRICVIDLVNPCAGNAMISNVLHLVWFHVDDAAIRDMICQCLHGPPYLNFSWYGFSHYGFEEFVWAVVCCVHCHEGVFVPTMIPAWFYDAGTALHVRSRCHAPDTLACRHNCPNDRSQKHCIEWLLQFCVASPSTDGLHFFGMLFGDVVYCNQFVFRKGGCLVAHELIMENLGVRVGLIMHHATTTSVLMTLFDDYAASWHGCTSPVSHDPVYQARCHVLVGSHVSPALMVAMFRVRISLVCVWKTSMRFMNVSSLMGLTHVSIRLQQCPCMYSSSVCPSTIRVDGRSVLEYVLFICTLLLHMGFLIPRTKSDVSRLERWDTDRVAMAQDCSRVPLCLCLDWPNSGSVLFRCLKVAIRTIGGIRSLVHSLVHSI